MAEYIEREAVNALIEAECSPKVAAFLNHAIDNIPAADVRPVGLLEQVEWERDTALAQLAEIGKSLGEKMDDVRPVVLCRDCKHNMANIPDIQDGININENWNACQLTELYDSVKPDDFCSYGEKWEES